MFEVSKLIFKEEIYSKGIPRHWPTPLLGSLSLLLTFGFPIHQEQTHIHHPQGHLPHTFHPEPEQGGHHGETLLKENMFCGFYLL